MTQEEPRGPQPTPTWTQPSRVTPQRIHPSESPLTMTSLGVTRGEDTQPACSYACTCHSGPTTTWETQPVMRERESTAQIPPSRWEINLPKCHLGTALQKHSSELARWMLPLVAFVQTPCGPSHWHSAASRPTTSRPPTGVKAAGRRQGSTMHPGFRRPLPWVSPPRCPHCGGVWKGGHHGRSNRAVSSACP